MDPNQHVAIYCVDQAMESIKKPLSKEKTAVIFGTGASGKIFDDMVRRTFFDRVRNRLQNNQKLNSLDFDIQGLINDLSDDLLKNNLPITEDSSAGYLQNITAARIANIFDFYGPSYTIDAACASALAAVVTSAKGLLNNEYDALYWWY